jgi:prepilin-type processing-associated H-X9-DG protein
MGAVFLLVLVCGVLMTPGLNSTVHPQTRCANNLRQFGGLFTSESMEHGVAAEGGVALFLSYRRKGFIQREREWIFVCPHDPDAREPTTTADSRSYDTVDLTDAEALGALCSYAVRDFARFPIADDGTDPETGEVAWIACDRQGKDGRTPHHDDGLNVLFADGAVQFKDRAFLGIAPEDPIIVGPGSPHPELRKMAFVPEPLPADDRR